MLYQLIMSLARSSHSLASLPKFSTGSIKATTIKEDTIQQNQGEMEFENAVLESNAEVKEKAHGEHVFH